MTRKQRKRLRRTGYAGHRTRVENTASLHTRTLATVEVAIAVEVMCFALASFRGDLLRPGTRHDEQAIATSAQWQRLGVVGRWWAAWMGLWSLIAKDQQPYTFRSGGPGAALSGIEPWLPIAASHPRHGLRWSDDTTVHLRISVPNQQHTFALEQGQEIPVGSVRVIRCVDVVPGSGPATVTVDGLAPGQPYHFRLTAVGQSVEFRRDADGWRVHRGDRIGARRDWPEHTWRREVLGQWVEPSSPPVFAPQTYTGAVRRLLGDRPSTMDYEIEHAVETSIADVDARAGAINVPYRDDLVVALAASRVARREGWSGERQMPLVERVRFLWDELERDTGERALRLNEPANWLRAERSRMFEERGAEAAAQLLAMAPPTMSPEAIAELRREFLPSNPGPLTPP